jgi:hypothetical protein
LTGGGEPAVGVVNGAFSRGLKPKQNAVGRAGKPSDQDRMTEKKLSQDTITSATTIMMGRFWKVNMCMAGIRHL